MLKFLSPGDMAADALGMNNDENRMIFRMFINTIVWGAVGMAVVIALVA
ncbi:MAG: hypothetical protein AAFR90_02680 [Pseudomonadota bacterium]